MNYEKNAEKLSNKLSTLITREIDKFARAAQNNWVKKYPGVIAEWFWADQQILILEFKFPKGGNLPDESEFDEWDGNTAIVRLPLNIDVGA